MQISYNTSPRTGTISYIVVHDTGNPSAGADAMAHFAYFNEADRGASADFFVDDKNVLQVNDYHTRYTWHCGDGYGKYGITNANSVGVELCINADGDYEAAFANLVSLVRHLMDELGLGSERVVRHYDASGKMCPASFAADNWARWCKFRAEIEEETVDMQELEELEKRVSALERQPIYDYIDSNLPAWAYGTVKKLADRGLLQGNERGELGLTDDLLRMLVVCDRAGVFGS